MRLIIVAGLVGIIVGAIGAYLLLLYYFRDVYK